MRTHFRTLRLALLTVTVASVPVRQTFAQTPAVAVATSPEPIIQYSRNESGGRVSLAFPGADSTALERQRLHLIELAAAIRRGDFRTVWMLPTEHPAMQVLAERRGRLRCTFRPTPRGGDLVLLSDDDAVVAALHQVLSEAPPRSVRL